MLICVIYLYWVYLTRWVAYYQLPFLLSAGRRPSKYSPLRLILLKPAAQIAPPETKPLL
jgi:hypothetical protein